jgi:hypothetical protein
MDSRTDLELWMLARADPDAFGVLFERHALPSLEGSRPPQRFAGQPFPLD